jgi:hypothetical protein
MGGPEFSDEYRAGLGRNSTELLPGIVLAVISGLRIACLGTGMLPRTHRFLGRKSSKWIQRCHQPLLSIPTGGITTRFEVCFLASWRCCFQTLLMQRNVRHFQKQRNSLNFRPTSVHFKSWVNGRGVPLATPDAALRCFIPPSSGPGGRWSIQCSCATRSLCGNYDDCGGELSSQPCQRAAHDEKR